MEPSARVRSSSDSPYTLAYRLAHSANSWPGDMRPYGHANDRFSSSGTTTSAAGSVTAGPTARRGPPGRTGRPVLWLSARYTTTTRASPAMIAAAPCAMTAPSASPPSGDSAKKVSSLMPRARTSMGSLTGSNGGANRHIPSTSAGSIPASAMALVTASTARSHAVPGRALPYAVCPMPTMATRRVITGRLPSHSRRTSAVCSPGCGGAVTPGRRPGHPGRPAGDRDGAAQRDRRLSRRSRVPAGRDR